MNEENKKEFSLPFPHIGMEISRVLKRKKITPGEFSAILGKQHQTGRRILDKNVLHCTLLHEVSLVLKHDFFQYYSSSAPAMQTELTRELAVCKEKAAGLEEVMGHLEREMKFLRKENEYLNQINRLLEERKG